MSYLTIKAAKDIYNTKKLAKNKLKMTRVMEQNLLTTWQGYTFVKTLLYQ